MKLEEGHETHAFLGEGRILFGGKDESMDGRT